MAENQIDIEVNLIGVKKAEKGLDKIEEAGSSVGETFGTITEAVKSSGGQFSEQLGAMGDAAGTLGSSVMALSQSVGQGFTAMLGPIGAVIIAVMELTQAQQEFNSEISGATIKGEAYAASVAEITSVIEALADAEVKLTFAQVKRLSASAMASQMPLEEAQLIRENNREKVKQIALIDHQTKRLKFQIEEFKKSIELSRQVRDLTGIEVLSRQIASADSERLSIAKKRVKIQKQINRGEEKALELLNRGLETRRQFSKEVREFEKKSPKFQRELQAKESDILEQALLARGEAQKDSLEMQQKAAIFAANKRIRDLRIMENIAEGLRAEAIEAERVKLNATLVAIEKSYNEKIKSERKKASQERRARLQREEAMRRQALMEAYQLRLLEIEQIKLQGAEAEEVLSLRLDAELTLVEDSATKRQMVNLKYENERLRLQKEADAKAEAERQRLEEHRRSFILESQAFDISMMEQMREKKFSEELTTHLGLSAIMEQGTEQELAALDLKYRREIEMKERSEEEITELTRRYNLERQAIQERAVNAQIDGIAQLTSTIGAGFADAAYASIFFGESFKDSAAEVIKGLGQQAAVEALMNTAKGLAAAVLNPAAAGAYFAAAAGFGVAATAAGVASASLGGGGGGGGSSAPTSPTGSPQIAPTADRDRATETQTVFNVNFGGAVIYDTRQAAELALADRITNLQNTNRRGAPRRR
jgi:hypothetical protein